MRLANSAAMLFVILALGAMTACGGDEDGAGGRAETQPSQTGATPPGADTATGPSETPERRRGDDDADSADRAGSVEADSANPASPSRTATRQARQAAGGIYDAIRAGDGPDGARLCDLMTARAQRETVDYVRIASGVRGETWTCEEAVAFMSRRAGKLGTLRSASKAEVIDVNVRGDRATATVRFGTGDVTALPLAKVGNEWKLDSSPSGK